MKKKTICCFLAACLLLAGCGTKTGVPVNGGQATPDKSAAEGNLQNSSGLVGQDWRTWGIIDGFGTLHIEGQDFGICACVFGDRVELYYDEPGQTLYRQIDYPTALSTAQYEKANVEFDDYTGDGNTDVRVTVGDKNAPELWWTWGWDTDDFVYMAALAYPPAMAAADASRQRYLSIITELHDSGKADQFALVYVDGDDVPELAAVSSEGSWDKEQIFLYTLDGDRPVLLASDIAPGMEGHSVAFCEGKNTIVCSGAAAGERRVCYAIGPDGPEQILSLEWSPNPANAGDISYFINGQATDEAHYRTEAGAFTAMYGTMIRLDSTEMSIVALRFEDGSIVETITGSLPYQSFEMITGAA